MRKSEEKALFTKLTKYIGKKITYRVQVEGWTVTEVAAACGLPINRVSEIKNYSNYDRPINETFLAAFIGGKLVTIAELKEKAGLSKEEQAFMADMALYYDNKPLKAEIIAAAKEGIDVVSLIQKARKENKK